MDYWITTHELSALCGLPHIQQLAYLRGLRPYMDGQTGIVGIKRKISYQSIAEQLYIEPHPGIKSCSFSRAQIRRALAGLDRTGLIILQSEGMQLILKCPLAKQDFSVQNKAVTKPSQKVDRCLNNKISDTARVFENICEKADSVKPPKADIPLNNNNYIYILFEKFWSLYPEKCSKQAAFEAFQELNPNEQIFRQLMEALNAQIQNRNLKTLQGHWVPPWKHPANWLLKRSFEDEVKEEKLEEKGRASTRKNTGKPGRKDPFWSSDEAYEYEGRAELSPECSEEDSGEFSNILLFKQSQF